MSTFRIAVIGGDGIGPEVVGEGVRVLNAAAELDGSFELAFEEFPWGSAYYLETGRMMPEAGLRLLREFDAIYLGAVGSPDVPDHITLWGLVLLIRQQFDLYVNLRPVRLLPGVVSPLRHVTPENVDMIFVRENSEGEYAGVGGRSQGGSDREVALQIDVFSRRGVERIARYAFGLARERRRKLASITKSNASPYTYVLWDEVIAEVGADYPEVEVTSLLVDAAAAFLITRPRMFDVLVASNLFGDILTDIGGAIQGSLGLGASANLNPEGRYPGMFEPVHGSAPDISRKGIANPLGAIWAAALMLQSLRQNDAAARVMNAIEIVLAKGETRTPDLGGSSTTREMSDAILEVLRYR